MQFSESQLVDMFLAEEHQWSSFPFKEHRNFGKGRSEFNASLKYDREYKLGTGRRCDLVVRAPSDALSRLFWIVEFKVEAGVDALIQVCEYYDSFVSELRLHTGIFSGAKSIAAQFFHPNVTELAGRLGISCLHLCPVNAKELRIEEIVYPGRRTLLQVNRLPKIKPFHSGLEVVNG